MKINEKIRFIRELKGWSQEEMAEKLNLSVGSYANIERGKTNIQYSRLEQISEVLDMTLGELINLDEKTLQFTLAVDENSNNNQLIPINISNKRLKLQHKIEMDRLKIEQQEKEISLLQEEINYLKEIIALMKKK